MNEILFKLNDLEVTREGERYFAKYDAGSHQVVMRKDEITQQDALLACKGEREALKMLFALQQRLEDAGIDPYSSNYDEHE